MSIAYMKHVKENPGTFKSTKAFTVVDSSPNEENGFGAKQEFKDECDINFILRGLNKTGIITHINPKEKVFGDGQIRDLQEALNISIEAEALFMKIPAKVRKVFDNNAIAFVEGVKSGKFNQLLDDNGLLAVKEIEKISKVEVVNQAQNNDDSTTKK